MLQWNLVLVYCVHVVYYMYNEYEEITSQRFIQKSGRKWMRGREKGGLMEYLIQLCGIFSVSCRNRARGVDGFAAEAQNLGWCSWEQFSCILRSPVGLFCYIIMQKSLSLAAREPPAPPPLEGQKLHKQGVLSAIVRGLNTPPHQYWAYYTGNSGLVKTDKSGDIYHSAPDGTGGKEECQTFYILLK